MSKANITVTVPSHYADFSTLQELPEGMTSKRLETGETEVTGDSADVSSFILELCLDDEDAWGEIMDTAR